MKKNLNERKIWRPKDPLAIHGYYTAPVQKVIDRWRFKIGSDVLDKNIESLMIACCYSVKIETENFFHHKRFALEAALAVEKVRKKWSVSIDDRILDIMVEYYVTPLLSSVSNLGQHLDPTFLKHRQFILELLLAVDYVFNDPQSLPGWILKFGFSGDGGDWNDDGRPRLRPWSTKVLRLIQESGGPKNLSGSAIRQEARRMRLTV